MPQPDDELTAILNGITKLGEELAAKGNELNDLKAKAEALKNKPKPKETSVLDDLLGISDDE